MHKITGRQSKSARALLKWNLYDLAHRVKSVQPKRIDSFEHGLVHLMEWENDELVRVFKKVGIHFKADLEVSLEKQDAEPEALRVIGTGDGAQIVLAADQSVISDSTAEQDNVDAVFPPESEAG